MCVYKTPKSFPPHNECIDNVDAYGWWGVSQYSLPLIRSKYSQLYLIWSTGPQKGTQYISAQTKTQILHPRSID